MLEAAGLPEPTTVNGVEQMPLHGVSMAYSFDDADAAERRTTQYFEMFCNRGIYHEGWTAVTRHSIPWMADRDAGVRRRRLGALRPGRLDAGARPRGRAARRSSRSSSGCSSTRRQKYNVLPLDDRRFERFNPDLAGRPQLVRGNVAAPVRRMGRLTENSILVLKNKSHAITAEIVVPEGGANGVIIVAGRRLRRLARSTRRTGKPAYCYNLFGLQRFKVYGEEPIPAGEHQVRMEFAYDGGGLGKGGDVTLYVDGEQVGEGRVEATGAHDLLRATRRPTSGSDTATPVSDDYGARDSAFTGRVRWVQLDIDEAAEDVDHLITPEERLQIAMARQ